MKTKLYTFKRFLFFGWMMFVAVCFNCEVKAQSKTVQLTQTWNVNDSSWRNNRRITTTYNNGCEASYDLTELWDTTANQWKISMQDSDYNNSFVSLDSVKGQSWNGNAWVNDFFLKYTYNDHHQLTSITVLGWNGSLWVNEERTSWTFDNNYFLISQLYQRWNDVSNYWLNQYQYLYTNNPDGTPFKQHGEQWDQNTNSWQAFSTVISYYYNSFGKDSVNIDVDSVDNINEQKVAFFYNANHFLINQLTYYPVFNNNGDWDVSSQILYSPNSQGLDTLVIYQNANGSGWINYQKIITTYASCVLPVTFLNFKAQQANNTVQLNWQTGSEVNAALFHLQRSTNGKIYTTIANINAKGKSYNAYNYKDNIASIHEPDVYYRLVEQDKDGKLQMSNIVIVPLNKAANTSFVVAPNPASSKIFITGGSVKFINIFDLNGKLLISQKPGIDNSINISQLHKGVYLARIQDLNNNMFTTKLVVQ